VFTIVVLSLKKKRLLIFAQITRFSLIVVVRLCPCIYVFVAQGEQGDDSKVDGPSGPRGGTVSFLNIFLFLFFTASGGLDCFIKLRSAYKRGQGPSLKQPFLLRLIHYTVFLMSSEVHSLSKLGCLGVPPSD